MNNKLILYCCINVFNISPTFMLPFKDIDNDIYYAQCSSENVIVGFEKIEIDQYRLMSKIYYLDTINYFSIGSNTVYSLDYNKGYIYGSCSQIISFYRNNLMLFDNRFVQYMSDFITKNKKVLLENRRFQMEVYRNEAHNNYSISSNPSSQSLITKTAKENKHEIYPPKSFDLFLHNERNIKNCLVDYINDSIRALELYDYRTYDLKSKRMFSLNKNERKLFMALYSSPPVFNLWSDKIVEAFVDINHFYDSLSFDKHFPSTMFADYIEWQQNDLPFEVKKKIDIGYSVQYLNIIPFPERKQVYLISAQDYCSGENRFKLFNGIIKARVFIEFTQELSNDMNKDICYIINPDYLFKHIINNEEITSMLESKALDFIFPPQSCPVPIL